MARKSRNGRPLNIRKAIENVSDVGSRIPRTATDERSTSSFTVKDRLLASAIVVAVFVVYQPCFSGGYIWDDDQHITRPELRSAHGLYRIWTDYSATSQYYPFLHSVFWLEYKLWGDVATGYHRINIAIHALNAVLVLAVLRQLGVPGAWLAATIFALHPVQVESVAWVTEQKNTLSTAFYLTAALAYFRFDGTRRAKFYALAACLFVLALLTKTVTATLPGGLLVVFWWQRGRISIAKDVIPLAPFFVIGAGFGLLSAWWELKVNRCFGPEFQFTFLDRLLIAGRTAWFCCWKLFWPANLTFIYPRWQIDYHAAWQYIFPAGAVALLTAAWLVRGRSRAPLAGLLFFGGTLFPVLGFFNLYTFRYSFVADHYQYLASLGIVTLVSAALVSSCDRMSKRIAERRGASQFGTRWNLVPALVGTTILITLSILTTRQTAIYADAEALYTATIKGNPECWMAYNNLGVVIGKRGDTEAATAAYREALKIKPDFTDPHINIGLAYAERGQFAEAKAEYLETIRIDFQNTEAHYNLGVLYADHGQVENAITEYRTVLRIEPQNVLAHNNLGSILVDRNNIDEAITEFRTAIATDPTSAAAHRNLAVCLSRRGEIDEAIAHDEQALDINPDFEDAANDLQAFLLFKKNLATRNP